MSHLIQKNTELRATLDSVPTSDLKRQLSEGLEMTVRHLSRLAAIWCELERRGEDLSDLRRGLFLYLPMIANRKVDPSLVVNYAGQKTLLAALASLPIEEQERISGSGAVTIVSEEGAEVLLPLTRLRTTDIPKIFDVDKGRIRTPDEQRSYTSPALHRQYKHHITSIIGFDRQDGEELLVVSGKRARISRVLNEIGKKYPEYSEQLQQIVSGLRNKRHSSD
ncbi:TPA: hypothetical protein JGU28_004491 [Salmonella enterica]|nr:hypothetical protein [Salmonella enterica]